ncbi:MAG: glycosyltransferase family 1 protein, partial [Chloroflexi bacterium]|nr:glycosyltransferase family 1 protein [Chloroflexota bacterium]
MKKMLYIGQLNPGGTCLDRMHALERLGYDVVGLNVSKFQSSHRVPRSIQWRFHPRSLLHKLNDEILRIASTVSGLDIIWVDKGIWVFPETLESVKRSGACQLVHYTPDSQLIINRSKHFLKAVKIYDHVITTKTFEVELYRAAGARNVVFVHQGYCPIRFANPTFDSKFGKAIGLISDYKPHYGKVIRRLAAQVPDVGVWGPKWRRAALLGRVPRSFVMGDGVWSDNYVNALASFRIGLGLLSKYIPEQHTTRSFEIPAAGGFLLAERTDEHLEYFTEGV